MKFENYKNKLVRPFIIYADTESTLAPTTDEHKINKHIINSCCFYFVCTFDSSRNELFTFEGDNCVLDMISKLYEISDDCIAEMQQTHKIDMKPWSWTNHRNATTCYLYDEPFDNSDKTYIYIQLGDHDHMPGQYRGTAACKCNINEKAVNLV